MQVIICLAVMLVFVAGLVARYIYIQSKRVDVQLEDRQTFESVLDTVARRIADLSKEDGSSAKDDIEYRAIYKRLEKIDTALTECIDGKEAATTTVKELIISILSEMFPTPEKLHTVFPFDGFVLDPHWEFEILCERLWVTHKKDLLSYLIKKYNWDTPKYDIEDGTVPIYGITDEELHIAFSNEIIDPLTFREELSVAATLLYQKYKGFGIIDTLRKLNINGFNIGTSGSIMHVASTNEEATDWKAFRSVWLFYSGKFIHMRFMSFDSESELRRVVQLLARYNNPGPLTEKNCYVVNTMEDKSRVLALRPPACEYWAAFVRKFVLSSNTIEYLLDPKYENDAGELFSAYNNTILPRMLIKMLMQGEVTTGFTGRQGSGKTTLMVAALAEVDARHTIRILEMAPEMYARELYPRRNILSAQETAYTSAAALQDAFKKSDAALSIVGEVATDIIAARMLQMAQVASIFTIFSHHANRTKDLVNAITNSVVSASGGAATPATVMPQVIDAIRVDCHQDYDVEGNRYVERVTEIRKLDEQPYPERMPGEPADEYALRLNKEYYTRRTDRELFVAVDVLHFDKSTKTYVADSWFSDDLSKHIFDRLPTESKKQWAEFVLSNWGGGAAKNAS